LTIPSIVWKLLFVNYRKLFFSTNSLVLLCTGTLAQTAPSTGDLLRESRNAAQPAASHVAPSTQATTMQPSIAPSGPALHVARFEVDGNTVFDASILTSLLADLVGRSLTLPELQGAADRLTLYYRAQGYHAVALLPEQDLQEGLVRLLVIEARLGQVKVERAANSQAVPLELVQAMVSRGQQPGQLLKLDHLNQANLIVADVPGLKSETALQQGAGPGQTDVISVVSSLPVWTGNAALDTNDARTTGRAKASVGLAASNAMGWGEQSTLALQKTQGKQFALLGYSHPVHPSGTRLAVSVGQLKYHLLNGSQVTGDANTWSLQLTQPWLRSEQINVSSVLSYNHNDSNTHDATGDSRSLVGTSTVGLNGNWLDAWAGGGFSIWALQWSQGAEDKTGQSAVERSFQKWTFNAWRMQQLWAGGQLSMSLNGQWSQDAMPGVESFSLGGATGVRAYPAFEGNGDRGWVGSLEYRHGLEAGSQFKVFYDHGRIHRLAATSGPSRYELQGAGVGWDVNVSKALQLKSALAWRIGSNPYPAPNSNLDADGSLRRPQFWFNAVYTF
jgi:hemolysin activation/secretion protein